MTMTNSFVTFLKVLYYIFATLLFLFAGSIALFVFVDTGWKSGADGVDILGYLIVFIIGFYTIKSVGKVKKSQDGKVVINNILKLFLFAAMIFLYGFLYEEIWRFEAGIRGIELLPRK